MLGITAADNQTEPGAIGCSWPFVGAKCEKVIHEGEYEFILFPSAHTNTHTAERIASMDKNGEKPSADLELRRIRWIYATIVKRDNKSNLFVFFEFETIRKREMESANASEENEK